MNLRKFLESASNDEIGKSLSGIYDDIVQHYVLRRWKSLGLDAGHFVEAVRRFLELKLFGKATPIAQQISNFNEAALNSYFKASGDEAYRVLIPRVLWAVYALRNKRSIGHLGAVPASEIDATLLLNCAKWVLSEIVRLESALSAEDTRKLVTGIISRQEPAIWTDGSIIRVLDNKLGAREKALVVLAFLGKKSEAELREAVRYKNSTNFRRILKRLDDKSLISFTPDSCMISPTGLTEAEGILGRSDH
jgi:hypothetical protein